MDSMTRFINSEGIEILIKIPADNIPWWSKMIVSFIHLFECFGFKEIK